MLARIALAVLFLSSFALAQSSPSVDLYGGYSFASIDTNGLSSSRESANGWEAAVSANVFKFIAIEGDVSGYYKSISGVNITDYAFAGGPRLNYRFVFAHVLFGSDRLTGSALGVSASQNSFTVIEGGGVQVPFAPHWSIRAGADWAETNHNILGGTRVSQNNFRAGVGIVFTIGRHATAEAKAESGPGCGTMSPSPHPVTLDQIGLHGQPNSYGFSISAVAPGSLAAKAGLVAGDFIVRVNCIKVHTAAELADVLSRVANPALVEVNSPTALPNQTQIRRLQVQP